MVNDLAAIPFSFVASEFVKHYLPTLASNTRSGYLVNLNLHLIPYLGDREVDDISFDDLDLLQKQLLSDLSPRSVRYVFMTLWSCLRWARSRGLYAGHIYVDYKLPRFLSFRPDVLSDDQMCILFDQFSGFRPVDICVRLAAAYGLRRGEILGLKISDIDFTAPALYVRRSLVWRNGLPVWSDGKTSSASRGILLSPEDADRLCRFDDRPAHDQHLFIRKDSGSTYTQSMLRTDFMRDLDAAKLPPVRFHDLRHSFASFMMRHGVNPKVVSSSMGHSSVSVTLSLYSWADLQSQSALLDAKRTYLS